MKTIVMAASAYGLTCIEAIRCMECVELVGVITTPAKYILNYAQNKKKEMENPIYKTLYEKCRRWNIPVYEIENMNSINTINQVKNWEPELIIVSGWYHFIGETIREIPRKGIIGLHSSVLPRYKGGAPLVWQMINGEETTGITLFYMSQGIDSGDIIAQREIKIEYDDTIKTLYEKVGEKGIELLKENLPLLAQNIAPRKRQNNIEGEEVYPQRTPEDGKINWHKDAVAIYNFVRAQTKPYPGAYINMDHMLIKIWSCEVVAIDEDVAIPGTIKTVEYINGRYYPIVATQSKKEAIKILDYSVMQDECEMQDVTWEKGKCID